MAAEGNHLVAEEGGHHLAVMVIGVGLCNWCLHLILDTHAKIVKLETETRQHLYCFRSVRETMRHWSQYNTVQL
uniref:Uncharacterized protein n=1 Tax=Brassica campestris TaxID=3711 RepID=M4DUW9_BRACM